MGDDAEDPAGRISDLESRSAGTDPDDPYEERDVSALPEWWQRAVREFDAHGLRPYRPPRFEDGTLTPPLVAELERELGVPVRIRSVASDYREEREVWVGDTCAGTVERHRSPDGYTVYELDSDRFARLVRSAVDRGDS